jgi:hypothetical protein
VTAAAGALHASRTVRVLPRGRRLVVLAAGDSLVANLAAGLRGALRGRGIVMHADVEPGRGLTTPDWSGFVWSRHAGETAERLEPDIVMVFLGGNEGFPIGSVGCCGTDWVDLLAHEQRAVMRAYARGGVARVYWSTLPAPGPSRPGHRPTWMAENLALHEATGDDDARIFDASELLTPGFGFRRYMMWHGALEKVRADDDIHLSRAGGRIAAEAWLAQLHAERVGVRR